MLLVNRKQPCDVVTMRPSTMPKLSLMTLASGARQLVVQEALLTETRQGNTRHRGHIQETISMIQMSDAHLTTFMELSYFSWLTPMTNMGASALGAEITTLLAPPFR